MRQAAPPLTFGRYPTPLERVERVALGVDPPLPRHVELWVKRDDRTHDVYGGNKVRKLEWLLADARARKATRIVTVGAAGSHHVLATAYFGIREGFEVEAVLVPQPRTDHVVEVLRAGVALGLRAFPVSSWPAAAARVAWRLAFGDPSARRWPGGAPRACFVTVGGSSVIGAMGYESAARELAAQVRAGEMPEPDLCVVALGSGGTAAGLAAGFARERLKTRVVGVCVSRPPWVLRAASLWLAGACARRASFEGAARDLRARPSLEGRLLTDARFLGRGYGHATTEGRDATRIALQAGIVLDPTYTAKAFAAALHHARSVAPDRGASQVILYWHTLSSAPMAPLLEGAPTEADLPRELARLLR
jgi:1-aminocyclopropane-1-carboxylate deaminase/D-cysteine desulfhydrase-like pyridoxal-dependent ACC family enzyme